MRRKIALVLAMLILFCTGGICVQAGPFYDIEGANYETAVGVLAALGIVNGITETKYAPESTLSRAEMATILLRTMQMESVAKGEMIFEDVPETHWAYAQISAALQLGIINGISETAFLPDGIVTYEQAVKMVVASLGYSLQAEAQGGYPVGYLAKAAQLDILHGVSNEAEMTRGNMALLLYNALDVPMFLPGSYGNGNYDLQVSEEDTLLSYYLKVDKISDYVSATPLAQLIAPSRSLLSDEVSISDGRIFKSGATDVQNMLGIRADLYVKTESDDYPGVVKAVVCSKNVVVSDINAVNIESETTRSTLTYEKNGKEEKVDVAGATLVWNGRVKEMWDDSDLKPKIGTVRLIQNGNNVERIIVESYQNYVVHTVVPETMEIFFMDSADPEALIEKVTVDPNDKYTLLVDEAFEPIPVEGCARWDVISIAESADKTVKKIIRCYNEIKGTVQEISDDTVLIDGKEYPLSDPLLIGTLTLGQTAAYFLDFTGTVTAVNTKVDASNQYGWLVSAAPKKGLAGGAQLKIFTQEGEMKVYDVADRIILDDIIYDDDALLDGKNELYKDGALYPQLVKYKSNDESMLITELDTAENRTLKNYTDAEKNDGVFSMSYYMGANRIAMEFNGTKNGGAVTGSTQYRLDNVVFAKVRVNERIPVFSIPTDITREDLYEVESMDDYKWDIFNQTKYLAVYDVSEDCDAGACVVHNYLDYVSSGSGGGGAGGGTGGETVVPSFDRYPQYTSGKVGLVTDVVTTLSDKGEPVRTFKIFNWLGGEERIRVSEDFECLYRAANADFLNDPDWYNVKGQERDESLLFSTSHDITTSSYYGYEFRPRRMRIDIKDIMPGDVLQYTVSNGALSMASVLLRGEYPGKVEMAASPTANELSNGNITVTNESNYYTGLILQMYATVVKSTENGPILSVNLSNHAGQPNGKTALRVIPNSGKFVLWDKEKKKMRTITPDEIRVNDELISLWRTTEQRLVIVYR